MKLFFTDQELLYNNQSGEAERVTIEMYEIYNELVRDLLKSPGLHTEYLDVEYSPEKGTHVKVIYIFDFAQFYLSLKKSVTERSHSFLLSTIILIGNFFIKTPEIVK